MQINVFSVYKAYKDNVIIITNRGKAMTKMMSLTKYEHQVIPKLRDQLNQSESVEDVKKFFIGNIQELLALATGGDLTADYEDILLLPDQQPYYSLAPQLAGNDALLALADSDLNAVLARLAEQAANRYKHVEKNNSKTKMKIKNH